VYLDVNDFMLDPRLSQSVDGFATVSAPTGRKNNDTSVLTNACFAYCFTPLTYSTVALVSAALVWQMPFNACKRQR